MVPAAREASSKSRCSCANLYGRARGATEVVVDCGGVVLGARDAVDALFVGFAVVPELQAANNATRSVEEMTPN